MSNLITKGIRIAIRIIDGTINSFAVVAAILVLFVTASILYEIIIRYFLRLTARWVFETTEYSLLFITFLATAWLLKEEGHVKMDLVLSRLKPENQAKISAVTSVICAMLFLIISWYSGKMVLDHFQAGYLMRTELAPPAGPILSIVPIGSFLLFIQFLRRAYGFLRSWRAT